VGRVQPVKRIPPAIKALNREKGSSSVLFVDMLKREDFTGMRSLLLSAGVSEQITDALLFVFIWEKYASRLA
jgi:hypothetical protein